MAADWSEGNFFMPLDWSLELRDHSIWSVIGKNVIPQHYQQVLYWMVCFQVHFHST